MSFTVADVIVDVREMIQDTMTPYRYDDAFIARKVSQVVRRMAILRPDLFTEIATITCVAGTIQATPSDSVRIMDVLTNTAGVAVKEVNQEVLDLMVPTWETLTPGPSTNWMRYPRSPNRFYVYPAATITDTLKIVYAKCPATLTAPSTVPLQDAYSSTVVDGTCWLMESIDAEHVESGRAKMFQDSFLAAMSSGLQARRITDTDTAAGPASDEV